MHLIIGGAYQGKLTFAKKLYNFKPEQIFYCEQSGEIDFSLPCITHIEEFVYGCVLRSEDALAYWEKHRSQWKDSILICRDISCGVVPTSPQYRLWRDETGRLCQNLARDANIVSRIFLGLEQRLK